MTRLGTAVLLVTLGLAGCDGGSGSSGVEGSKQISAVSDGEKASLCDWVVTKFGPYGSTPACAEAELQSPPSKAECISSFPACAVTVGQLEACINTVAAAQATCTEASLASIQADMNCQAAGLAGCFD